MTERKHAYGRAQLDRATSGDGPLRFVASSNVLNRRGFSLRNDGWRLDNYNANPVLLWMHNPYQPPIGRGRALNKGDQIILDEVTFDAEDELARAVESKFRRGFLSAVSVSWEFMKEDGTPVLDWWRLKADEIRDELFYDLAEVSAVSIPADPKALIKQSRLALANLGRELVDLFEERERPDGEMTAEQLRAAVHEELTRLGIDPAKPPEAPASGLDNDAAQAVLAAFKLEGTPK